MSSFEDSYIGQLRKLVGNRRLLTPGVGAFIFDDRGRILLIRRRDDGRWAMPAGMMELAETVYDAMRREVREETGIEVLSATLVAIYSGPRFSWTNQFGSKHQGLGFQFRVDDWSGSLVTETDETVDAGFFDPSEVPNVYPLYEELLSDLNSFDGHVILK